jgi:hypothetical protein
MIKKSPESRIQVLELRLEEAVQMLRLVAKNQRTCMEVEEWLSHNHPEDQGDTETVQALLRPTKKKK